MLVNTITTVYRTIKMKPVDVMSDSYAGYNKDSNEKDPKFKIGDHEKYKDVFAKGWMPNWSEVKLKLKIQFRESE